MTSYPKGSFYDETRVFQAGPSLWTSQMFPFLEPYTYLHKAFFRSMLTGFDSKHGQPGLSEKLFILLRDFVIVWQDDKGDWYRLVIPAGFVTDVASIPLILQLLFKVRGDGKIRPAALPHDLLYQLKELMREVMALYRWVEGTQVSGWVHDTRPWSKKMMDKFFAKMMKAYGAKLGSLTYWGVRLGGGIAYLINDPVRYYTASLYSIDPSLRNSWPR